MTMAGPMMPRHPPRLMQVLGHEVPVFLRDPEVLKSLDWDLALKQVGR